MSNSTTIFCPICKDVVKLVIVPIHYEEFDFKTETTEHHCTNTIDCGHIWLSSMAESKLDWEYRIFLQNKLREANEKIKKFENGALG